MNKLIKITIWKDLIALLVVLTVISCIFIFQIPIHFSVFEGIDIIPSIILAIFSCLIVVLTIFIIIYKIKKSNELKEEIENDKK